MVLTARFWTKTPPHPSPQPSHPQPSPWRSAGDRGLRRGDPGDLRGVHALVAGGPKKSWRRPRLRALGGRRFSFLSNIHIYIYICMYVLIYLIVTFLFVRWHLFAIPKLTKRTRGCQLKKHMRHPPAGQAGSLAHRAGLGVMSFFGMSFAPGRLVFGPATNQPPTYLGCWGSFQLALATGVLG